MTLFRQPDGETDREAVARNDPHLVKVCAPQIVQTDDRRSMDLQASLCTYPAYVGTYLILVAGRLS